MEVDLTDTTNVSVTEEMNMDETQEKAPPESLLIPGSSATTPQAGASQSSHSSRKQKPVANLISTNLPPISSPCSRLQKDISATRIGDEVVQADFIVTKEVDRASQEVDRASQEVHIETREVHKNAQATVTKQPLNLATENCVL